MTYATLKVHLQAGGPNVDVLLAAEGLAEQFQAGVIGIAACQPLRMASYEGYLAGDVFERDREQKDTELRAAEAEFRAAFRARTNVLEWRSTVTFASTSAWVANEARSADLVITAVATKGFSDPGHHVDTGELVMQAGRPVLVVPSAPGEAVPSDADAPRPGSGGLGSSGPGKRKLDHAMIAWKDTRETRRAVLDALPLLQKLAKVSVVEVAAKDGMADARRHTADVTAWLGRHGVAASGLAVQSDGGVAAQLDAIAQDRGADVIVAGAYGHSRVREWALGGVTRNLLVHGNRCSLLSH